MQASQTCIACQQQHLQYSLTLVMGYASHSLLLDQIVHRANDFQKAVPARVHVRKLALPKIILPCPHKLHETWDKKGTDCIVNRFDCRGNLGQRYRARMLSTSVDGHPRVNHIYDFCLQIPPVHTDACRASTLHCAGPTGQTRQTAQGGQPSQQIPPTATLPARMLARRS